MTSNHERDEELNPRPAETIDRIVGPLARFLHVEAASGVVLLIATIVALVLANSPLSESFLAIWDTKFNIGLGNFQMNHSLKHWISDGLMAIFFFVIGLEVKRELVLGQLSDIRRAALPIAAALGGMVVPAGIYLALQAGEPAARGWGIPMATDIAFVVGCLAVLGSRIPQSLRILLLSLAIADDIGAILVIAIGYTESLNLVALALGGLGVGGILMFARLGVRSMGIYTILGTGVWLAFHESGVHATIAGVILGLITPVKSWVVEGTMGGFVDRTMRLVRGEGWHSVGERYDTLRRVERAARESISPLQRLETQLHPYVGFFIMPLFALANAGVEISVSDFRDPVATAVMMGLFVGKPVGILATSWIAVRLGLARLPDDLSWSVLTAAGFLAGIGFTMALFIAGLALDVTVLDAAKVGVLAGSAMSGVVGVAMLVWLLPRKESAEAK